MPEYTVMRVDTRITHDNYVDFNVYHASRVPGYWRTLAIMAFTLPLALVAIAFVVMDHVSNNWAWLLFAGVVSIYWIFTTPRRFRNSVRKHVLKLTAGYSGFVGEFSLVLHPEFIEFSGPDKDVDYSYDDVSKVVWNKGCYYLIVGANSALIVPESSFAGQLAEQKFLDALREKCPEAKFLI